MGMSASQARLLTLTARLSDLELRAQQISNSKIRLAVESEDAALDYTNSLNKKLLTVLNGYDSSGNPTHTDLTFNNLTGVNSPLLTQYGLSDKGGNILVTKDMAQTVLKTFYKNMVLKQLLLIQIIMAQPQHW
jgi:hypothetical protein